LSKAVTPPKLGEPSALRLREESRDVALKVLPEAFAKGAGRMARFQREV
jgi:hypothetical protein